MPSSRPPRWMNLALIVAGLYGLAWSLALTIDPAFLFSVAGLPVPTYPELTRLLGVGVGLLSFTLLLAASNPYRHWPVVLMGFLAQCAGAGFALWGVWVDKYPVNTAWLALADDLVWLPILGLTLKGAYEASLGQRRSLAPEVVKMALRARTQHGVSLDELSRLSPTLVVFLRHAGCTFCREALADLAGRRAAIEEAGARLVLVHMGTEEHAAAFFSKYRLGGVPRVSDPARNLYRAFGLRRGSFAGLFGPRVWWRGFQAGILARHGVGRLVGDGFQMPGAFLLFHGEVVRSYRHQSAADRPDYLALVTGHDFARAEVQSQRR